MRMATGDGSSAMIAASDRAAEQRSKAKRCECNKEWRWIADKKIA